ncbi:2'-5' RNA ligase family protein [Arthrobacter sp. yr096]|uniref:2'-5' RNA ligase family protein n=1 Tax=Arthrobacter sp. yr096 TaxID=1761750 RepID=UPI000B87D8E3|nr:2'-5' RNA ligase family protein [Arthrobacter sp. yr096]
MRNLIWVAFTEPVQQGLVFPRSDWPLHITLLRFDVGANVGADVADVLADLAEAPVKGALGTRLRVGEEAGFGHLGSIPVSLIEHNPLLQGLHEELVEAANGVGGRIATPNYVMERYRPHISHHDGKRPKSGDAVVLDQVALVDMAPEGDHTIRRILRLWTQDAQSLEETTR